MATAVAAAAAAGRVLLVQAELAKLASSAPLLAQLGARFRLRPGNVDGAPSLLLPGVVSVALELVLEDDVLLWHSRERVVSK